MNAKGQKTMKWTNKHWKYKEVNCYVANHLNPQIDSSTHHCIASLKIGINTFEGKCTKLYSLEEAEIKCEELAEKLLKLKG